MMQRTPHHAAQQPGPKSSREQILIAIHPDDKRLIEDTAGRAGYFTSTWCREVLVRAAMEAQDG